jgi:hypothetical protein
LKQAGCPILVSPHFGETEPALSEVEGVGILTPVPINTQACWFGSRSPP